MTRWIDQTRQVLLPVFAAMVVLATVLIVPNSAGAQTRTSHKATHNAAHMQLRNSSGKVLCSKYNTSASSRPTAQDCPVGTWTQLLWDGDWKEIKPRRTVTVSVGQTNTTNNNGPSSHTATRNAAHMQLRNSSGKVLCFKYNTSSSSRPTAQDCPAGTWTQLLWDSNWKEIKPRQTVTVAGTKSTTNTGTSGSPKFTSYQATRPAVKMELWDFNQNVVCSVSGTSSSSRPVANNCPTGRWTQVLFDRSGNEIKPREMVRVTVGPAYGYVRDAAAVNDNRMFNNNLNKPSASFSNTEVRSLMDFSPFALDDAGVDGDPGDGNFRVTCQYSHFNYDDPILRANQPGSPDGGHDEHLHMFFGNTETDAYTSSKKRNGSFISNSGGGSCNGFELNRSAYWTPAVLDGRGNVVVPYNIHVYYKTKTTGPGANDARNAVVMEEGLKLISGNGKHVPSLNDRSLRDTSEHVFWSCGSNGDDRKRKFNYIPSLEECGGEPINATIYFPQCWNGKTDNTRNPDGSYYKQTQNDLWIVGENDRCPDGYVRMPRLGILMYFAPQDTTYWRLSSDRPWDQLDKNGPYRPGGTLHADWMGGWHQQTIEQWTKDCVNANKNCDSGQTGVDRMLKRLNGVANDDYGTSNGTDNHAPLSQYQVPIIEINEELGF